MRLDERVALVGGGTFGVSHGTDCNVYAVRCGSSAALIDAGSGADTKRILDNVQADWPDLPISHLFATHGHWDHVGGMGEIQQRHRALLAGHPALRESMQQGALHPGQAERSVSVEMPTARLDKELLDGQCMDVDEVSFTCLHVPGHTRDHIALVLRAHNYTALFCGDTVLGEGTMGLSSLDTDFRQLQRSLVRLEALDIGRMFPGHREFVLEGASSHIRHLRQNLEGSWASIVPGPAPFLPTWWLLHGSDVR